MKDFAIIYGEYINGIQKKAVELLSEFLLEFTGKYPLCVRCGEENTLGECTKIYIGTKENNEYINKHSNAELHFSEEYAISVKSGTALIEGSDDAGVLYGCSDFYNKYLALNEYTHDGWSYVRNPFESTLPDFLLQSHPATANRGIWTWGHVIYDYRSFIDNMVKLKMNTIIIWNDNAPVNGREIVEYAHNSGIKVIWGYAWFWDTDCNIIDIDNAEGGIEDIIATYERDYLPLGGDGIYFQSFTETDNEYIGGKLIAEAVTDFVNKTSALLLKRHPNLELQFGLHANSVKEKLEYIKKVNSDVRIVWENCGAFPFDYRPDFVDGFENTMDFISKIAKLRGENDSFGVVTKGLTKLDWSKFTHMEAPVFIGTSSKRVWAKNAERKRKIWRYIQSYWLTNADYAKKAVKLMSETKKGNLYITALIEDGMFEKNIMFPAALYAEMLWDTESETNKQINEVALRDYVEFA